MKLSKFSFWSLLIFALIVCAPICRAEEEGGEGETTTEEAPTTSRAAQLERVRQMVISKLREMLTNKDGTSANIVLITPIDYTNSRLEESSMKIIEDAFSKYGNLNIKRHDHELKNVTLEEFRKGMAKFDADVMVVCILRTTTFDLYIYDRRSPYYIYAHSEPLPATTTFPMDAKSAEHYMRLLVRRTLFHYARNQYYELPREESIPILTAEIPRWIASIDSLKMINREMLSKYWASIHLGAAMTLGDSGKVWNSNLLGFNVAYRFHEKYYGEFNMDFFSYNTATVSVRYLFTNRDSTYKIAAGLGIGLSLLGKTLDFDRTFGVNSGTLFAVPSLSVLYPLVDVYLKADAKLYVGVTRGALILMVSPGLLMFF